MLAFFLLSSLLSKAGSSASPPESDTGTKRGPRDAMQVMANGGLAGTAVLLWLAVRDPALYGAFLGTVAAATADTWGTEIGMWFGRTPRMITTFRIAEPGRSGAVSLPGFAAGLLGAGIIGLSALPWMDSSAGPVLLVVSAGMAGTVADSLAGAAVQARFRCPVCGRIVEKPRHCAVSAGIESGVRWIDNDVVNFACTFTGGILGFLLWPEGGMILFFP
jgi:uncharacterized protein (TIGR00297 family)